MSFTGPWWPLNPPPNGNMSSSTSGVFVSKCKPKLEDAAVSLRKKAIRMQGLMVMERCGLKELGVLNKPLI
jgi:hypothetical protein